MTDNPAKYFDAILKFLSTDYNRIFTFNEVLNELHKDKRDPNDKAAMIFDVEIEPSENLNFLNALMFLQKQGLVWYSLTETLICIETAGYIKIKTKGFNKEIKEAKKNLRYQRMSQIASPTISLIALIISILSLIIKNVPDTDNNVNGTNNCEDTQTYFH